MELANATRNMQLENGISCNCKYWGKAIWLGGPWLGGPWFGGPWFGDLSQNFRRRLQYFSDCAYDFHAHDLYNRQSHIFALRSCIFILHLRYWYMRYICVNISPTFLSPMLLYLLIYLHSICMHIFLKSSLPSFNSKFSCKKSAAFSSPACDIGYVR